MSYLKYGDAPDGTHYFRSWLSRRAQNKCARRELAQATKGAEEGSRSLGAARAIVQKARADQAETDARARKTTMAARFGKL